MWRAWHECGLLTCMLKLSVSSHCTCSRRTEPARAALGAPDKRAPKGRPRRTAHNDGRIVCRCRRRIRSASSRRQRACRGRRRGRCGFRDGAQGGAAQVDRLCIAVCGAAATAAAGVRPACPRRWTASAFACLGPLGHVSSAPHRRACRIHKAFQSWAGLHACGKCNFVVWAVWWKTRDVPVAGVAARPGPLCSVAVASSVPGRPAAVAPLLPDVRLWLVAPPACAASLRAPAWDGACAPGAGGPRSLAGAGSLPASCTAPAAWAGRQRIYLARKSCMHCKPDEALAQTLDCQRRTSCSLLAAGGMCQSPR